METMIYVIILIISIIITVIILNVINKNTFGTTGAYIRRAFLVWVIVFFILGAIANEIGLIHTSSNDKEAKVENNVSSEETEASSDYVESVDVSETTETMMKTEIAEAGNGIILESYITFGQNAEEMAQALADNGIDMYYYEDYEEYGTNDASITIKDVDTGTSICDLKSEEIKCSLLGVSPDMTLEEAEKLLLSSGATDETLSDDVGVRRYVLDGMKILIGLEGDSISIECISEVN